MSKPFPILSTTILSTTTRGTIIAVLTIALATSLAAQGRPAATAASSEPLAQKSAAATKNDVDDDKDINPFTGQSNSEAQLRRILEREKLITAIAGEKTKQTQSNSELQLARLRNAAEKNRFATESRTLIAPVPVSATAPKKPATAIAPDRPLSATLPPPAFDAPAPALTPAWTPAPAVRSEIRFADEIVELKAQRPSGSPSVVASVDTQRSTDPQTGQPRAITPISIPPAGLPVPQVQPVVPAPIIQNAR